jgi:hypothetical protein
MMLAVGLGTERLVLPTTVATKDNPDALSSTLLVCRHGGQFTPELSTTIAETVAG